MPSDDSRAITRYHVNPAFTTARDIYADGAEIARSQRVLHLSGQVGIRPDGTTSPDFAEQCDQALANLIAVLKAASMTPDSIVKLTCYVVGQQPLAALYDARRRHLPNVAPASTTLIVHGLAAPEWLIEIEAIAAA
jgi:2-iminobutanoate/2-iminopropanoate deaminase